MKNESSIKIIVLLCLIASSVVLCQPVPEDSSPNKKKLKVVPFNKLSLEDFFWKPRLDIQSKTLVPYALDKTIPAVENLTKAAKFLKGDSSDLPFPHRYISSDLYKAMEGASYILMNHPDSALEKRMDDIIDIIAAAQKEDGYLYVAHITGVSKNHDHWGGGGMGDKPYSFVLHSHELYNMGHMYEAAIAYYMATEKDKWLKVAEKNARHINKVFFEGDPAYNNGQAVMQAPGHQEIELALVKLHNVTGKNIYLEMADKFLDIRGRTYVPEGKGVMSPTYSQQHKPVSEQRKTVGHAVRAVYMYSAMADVSSLLAKDDYEEALDSIWHNIVDTKMHITGGLGAMHGIEGFGPEYELPNKEAYNETCAAVGNVFFNFRMFLMTHDAKYMDIAEIALLNNVLAGVNMEGNKFFYVNPLESDGITPFNHGSTVRSPWFGTSCCPTNLARLIPQVSGMMYSYTEDEIFASFYASSSTSIPLKDGMVKIVQRSDYPFDEKVNLSLYTENPQFFKLKLRIPTWAGGQQFVPGDLYHYLHCEESSWYIKVNNTLQKAEIDKGFAVIEREWEPGDEIELFLGMDVKFNIAHEKVLADVGRLAITRGPFVYCAESMDANNPVQNISFNRSQLSSEIASRKIDSGILNNVISIDMPVNQMNSGEKKSLSTSLIPYYAWNNRGNSSMIVWIPINEEL